MDVVGKPAPAPDLKEATTIPYKEKCQNENILLSNGLIESSESVGIRITSPTVSLIALDSVIDKKPATLNSKSSQKPPADKAQKISKATKKCPKSSLAIADKTSVKSNNLSIPDSIQTPVSASNKLETKKYSKNGVKKQSQNTNVQKKEYFKFPMNRSRWCDGKGEKPFKCNICEKFYKYMFSLKRHYLRIHINEDYISEADLANCKINVNGDRRERSKDVITSPNRKRLKTGNSFDGNEGKPGLYKCSFHKVKYDLETELKNHYATVFHPKKEEFICKICKEIFETKAKLCDHVKACSHSNEEVANHCKKCKVTFQSSADYEYHLSIHGNGKFCKYCNKEFSNIANRKRHENLHDGSQSFKCKHCEFSSQAKKDLNIHIRKLHMDLYYRCDKCPKYGIAKIYATKSLLQAHMVERHGEKKEVVSKTVTPVKTSHKIKGPQNHLKSFQLNAVAPKSSTLDGKSVATETKNIILKPPQSCQSSCVCNLCKKAFPDVRAMLRHKNIAHKKRTTYKRKVKKTIKVKTLTKKPTKKEIEEEQLRFYQNVSYNIADNLLHYVDGTINQLHLSDDSSFKNRTLSDPESWNLNFSDHFGKPCSSNTIPTVPEKVRPPEIFIATGLDKIDGCPNKTSIPENSPSLTEFMKEFKLNVLNNDIYFSKQAVTKCFCHVCSVKIKEAQKQNVEERKKMIEHKKSSIYVCLVCKEPFNSDCDFDEHCYNNHPLIDMQSILIKIESDKNKPPIIPYDLSRKVNPTPHGILTSDSHCSPFMLKTQFSSRCTKCKTIISPSFLHEHILRCGDNDSYFVKKYFRKRMRRKRIKNTMKHYLDLTVKQLPSGERKRYKDFRIQKEKFKGDKNYFNFKNGKANRSPFASVKETTPPCSACNKRFPSQAQLKNHQCSADKLKKLQKLTEFKDVSLQNNINSSLSRKDLCKRDLSASFQSTTLSNEQCTKNTLFQNVKRIGSASSETSNETLRTINLTPQPCHILNVAKSTNLDAAMDLSISKKPAALPVTPDKHLQLPSNLNKDLTKSPIDALKETIDRLTNKEVTKLATEKSKTDLRNKDKVSKDNKGIPVGKNNNSKLSTIVKIIAKKDVKEKNISPSKDLSGERVTENKNILSGKTKLGNSVMISKNKAHRNVTNEIAINPTNDELKVKKGTLVEEVNKKTPVPLNKNGKAISALSNSTQLEQNPCLLALCNSTDIEREQDQTKSNSTPVKKSKKSLDEALKKITKSKPQIFDSTSEPTKASVSLEKAENHKNVSFSMAKVQSPLLTNNLSPDKDKLVNTHAIGDAGNSNPKSSFNLHLHEISISCVPADKSVTTDLKSSEFKSIKLKHVQPEDNNLSVSKRSRKKLTPSKIVQSKSDVTLSDTNTDNNLKETINNKIKGLSQSIAKQLFTQDNKSSENIVSVGTPTDAKLPNQLQDSSLNSNKINNLNSSEINKNVASVVSSEVSEIQTEVPIDIQKTKPLFTNLEKSKETENPTVSETILDDSETNKMAGIFVSNSEADKKAQILESDSHVNKKCETLVNSTEIEKKILKSSAEISKKDQIRISSSKTNNSKISNDSEVIEKIEAIVARSTPEKKTETTVPSLGSDNKCEVSLNISSVNIGEMPAQLEVPSVNEIPPSPEKVPCSITVSNSFKTIQAAENKSEALPILQAPVLFLSNECLNSEVASTQDRDSPTLEVLVSSVTQNLENFDEQSCMDDDKFSFSDPIEDGQSKTSKTSLGGSLNFKVIMPESGKIGVSHPLPIFPTETIKTTEQTANQFCIASGFSDLNKTNEKVMLDNFNTIDSLTKNVNGANLGKNISSLNNSASTFAIPLISSPIKGLDNNVVSLTHKEISKPNLSDTKKGDEKLNELSSSTVTVKNKIDNTIDINSKPTKKEAASTSPTVKTSILSPVKARESFENEISLLHKVSKTYSKGIKSPTDALSASKSQNLNVSSEIDSPQKNKSKLSLGRKGKKKISNELDISETLKDETTPTSVSHLRAFRHSHPNDHLDANASQANSNKSIKKQKEECATNKDSPSQISEPDNANNSSISLDQKDIKKELDDASIIVKRESFEGAKKHACPYCMLEFAYLTNFRRHTRQCRSRAAIRCREQPSASSSYFMQHLPKKEEVEESMLNLLRHQIRQNQMIQEVEKGDAEKEIVPAEPKKLQTYTCPFCHKIFLKLFEQVRHLTNVHLLSNEESKVYLNNQKSVDQSKLSNEESIPAISKDKITEVSAIAINIDQNSLPANSDSETSINKQNSCSVGLKEELEINNTAGVTECEQMLLTKTNGDANKIQNEEICSDDRSEKISDTTDLVKTEDVSRNEMNATSPSNENNITKNPQIQSNASNSNGKEHNSRQRNKNNPSSKDLRAYGQKRGRKKKSIENESSLESKSQDMLSIPCLKEESSSDSTDQRTDKGNDVDEDELDNCSPKNIVVSKLKDTISHKMRLLASKCLTPGPLRKGSKIKEEDPETKTHSDSNLSNQSSDTLACEQAKDYNQSNSGSGVISEPENELFLPMSSTLKRGRGRKSAPNLTVSPDSKPTKGRRKRFSDTNILETPNCDLVTSTSSESPKRSKRASENNATKVSSPKTSRKRKVIRNKELDASTVLSKTDSTVPHAGVKDLSNSSLPSTSSLSNSKVKRLRRTRFPNYCDSESSFTSAIIPYDHSDSDDFVSSPEKRPAAKKKVLQKVCPICKKKFTASLERNRHVQLVHSRKGLETEESPVTPPVQIIENKPKKEIESPKSRTSHTRQCAKPLPPMKRKYEKQPNKEVAFKKVK